LLHVFNIARNLTSVYFRFVEALREFKDYNDLRLLHDVFGIARHLSAVCRGILMPIAFEIRTICNRWKSRAVCSTISVTIKVMDKVSRLSPNEDCV
jgi:hypothetical protein